MKQQADTIKYYLVDIVEHLATEETDIYSGVGSDQKQS